jgi:multidrug resistance efflux pump
MQPSESTLFRPEALDHYLQADEGLGRLRVSPPWTWTLLLVLLAALGSALAGACWGRVEVTGRGRGILRPPCGVRTLLAQVGGTVAAVAAHSGQAVQRGQPLLQIHSPTVQAQRLEARCQSEAVRRDFRVAAALQDRAHAQHTSSLDTRCGHLRAQIDNQAASVARFERQLSAHLALERAGIVSLAQADQAREALAQAQRQLSSHQQALEQVLQERAALDHQRQESLWQRRQTILSAAARERALAVLAEQAVVRAPQAGWVEAMLVQPGEVVQPGQALGRWLSLALPLEVVCFLAERDRAFVHPGDEALLELDQLPYPEFGTLRARVVRIGEGLASPFELREALGGSLEPAPPCFRVELRILEAGAAESARVQLRPGMLANVRFTLRRQALITLVLEPLRRWLR